MESIFQHFFGCSYFDLQEKIKKDEKAYDDYIVFLNELEVKLQSYGKSVSSLIKKLQGMRGYITSSEIHKQKNKLLQEYKIIEENAKAFDTFQEFYEIFKENFSVLTSEKWSNIENYCDKKNRSKYTPDEFEKLRRKMESKYDEKLQEKAQNLSLLEKKLQVRNIELDNYLGKRHRNGAVLTKENVSTHILSILLESMDLMDEIDSYLIRVEITIEDYLKSQGKTIEEITKNELKVIRDTLKEHSYWLKISLSKFEKECREIR